MTNLSTINRKYGWKPNLPSLTIQPLNPILKSESELPQEVDLENTFPACYDQGQLGSCTANEAAGLVEHRMIVCNYKWQFTPSRLMIYYNERAEEGTINSDAGGTIADSIAVINKFGVCPEVEANGTTPNWLWPYSDQTEDSIPFVEPAPFKQKPPKQCYEDAVLHKAIKSQSVDLNRLEILNVLAQQRPIGFGFTVYSSFETQSVLDSGFMLIPQPNEEVLGGHAVIMTGYKLNWPMGTQGVTDWIKVRNSWGADIYGQYHGYFWMPLDQVAVNPNITSDAHVIDLMTGENQHD